MGLSWEMSEEGIKELCTAKSLNKMTYFLGIWFKHF